jgi:hypothetical protein
MNGKKLQMLFCAKGGGASSDCWLELGCWWEIQ